MRRQAGERPLNLRLSHLVGYGIAGIVLLWLSFVIKHACDVNLMEDLRNHPVKHSRASLPFRRSEVRSTFEDELRLRERDHSPKAERSLTEWRAIEEAVARMDNSPLNGDHFQFLDSGDMKRGVDVLRNSKGIGEMGEKSVNHLVVVTDCTFQADWQTLLLFHSARSVNQEGRLTRIAIDCSDKAKFELHNQYVRLWPREYHVFFYDSEDKGVEKVKGEAVDDFVRQTLSSSSPSGAARDESAVVVVPLQSIFLRASTKFCHLAYAGDSREVAGVVISTVHPHLLLTPAGAGAGAEQWGLVDSLGEHVCDLPHPDAHTTHGHVAPAGEGGGGGGASTGGALLLLYAQPSRPTPLGTGTGTGFVLGKYAFPPRVSPLLQFRCSGSGSGSGSGTLHEGEEQDQGQDNGQDPPSLRVLASLLTPSAESRLPAAHRHSHYPEDPRRMQTQRQAFGLCQLYRQLEGCAKEVRSRACGDGGGGSGGGGNSNDVAPRARRRGA